MKKIWIHLLIVGLALSATQAWAKHKKHKTLLPFQETLRQRMLYVGKDSTEAIMNFDHEVELDSVSQPSYTEARKQIDQQVVHLFGPMGAANYPGVPKNNHEITKVQILPHQTRANAWVIRYHYKGTVVIKNGPETEYEVLLPMDPSKIYDQGLVGYEAPCTDATHRDEKYFWYFWNPDKYRCPLKENVHYKRVNTTIQRLFNTAESYPEYDRLADESGVVSIHVFLGMDDPSSSVDPIKSTDINADNYRQVRASLVKLGFKPKKVWSKEEIFSVATTRPYFVPYVEELEKQTTQALLRVRMFFGPTHTGGESTAFYYFFNDALLNSSMLIYDGHSGLGEYLSLPEIKQYTGLPLRPNPNQYQIYYFNSCSSYPYYNDMFFHEKVSLKDPRGTKNLDIFTNGLSTFFSVMNDTNVALLKAVNAWAEKKGRISYQELAQDIDSGNLFGINGDEDNN